MVTGYAGSNKKSFKSLVMEKQKPMPPPDRQQLGCCVLPFIIMVCLVALFSCKTKLKQRDKFSQKVELASVKSTLITTVIDTTLQLRGDTAKLFIPFFLLAKGNPYTAENNGTVVTLQYDAKTQSVRATGITQPKTVNLNATKTEAKTEALKAKSNTKESKSATTVKTDVEGTLEWVWWLLLIAAAIGGLIYLYVKNKIPFLPYK